MNTKRVILIGLDGLGWNEIKEWVNDDCLSNINTLASEGCRKDLASTHPPWTPVAWPSLLSGKNPGKHGIFDFFTREGYDKRLVERPDIDAAYVHEVADALGQTPVVINFPLTHPATQLENGAVVPGYLAREDVKFYPEGLRDDYESEFGKYRIYPDYGAEENQIQEYIEVARHRRDMATFLAERYDWDFLAVQFQVTDSIFHDLSNRNDIRSVLEKIDGFIGDIRQLGNDDTPLFIVSDHGMGDYEWTFYVNSWLMNEGYCETTIGEENYFRSVKNSLKGKDPKPKNKSSDIIQTIIQNFTKIGLSPYNTYQFLSTLGLSSVVEKLIPEEILVSAQSQVVDYPNSKAFQIYFNSLGIHINVDGREPQGQVLSDDYESLRTELIDKLESTIGPDGKPVFDKIQRCEEVYEGDHMKEAPDLVLFPRDFQYDVSGSIMGPFRSYAHKNHKPDGILISNNQLEKKDKMEIYDIAPTIASTLGIPIDEDTDGTVVGDGPSEISEKNWDELVSYKTNSASNQDTSDVEDRLADLGYME